MKTVKIKIILNDGRIMNADLFPEYAPISVENFINLIKNKYFDGLIFHRVIKGFMIQGGGMNLEMQEKSGLTPIKGEFSINGWNKNATTLKHEPGVLSMARTNVMDSATSQFFIVTGDAKFLDGQYASFGKLADQESLNVALEIENVPTTNKGYHDDVPVEPIIIKTIELV
ncbi:peptidylprolyl isomerase [Spiroplasma culicicola]|uniref:Peptidyl-prolyl cis-trans isomerase n=1 Tax=Spiroplasma culicicola AES-1 TaxID=1276246 RepID=W6A5H5_9MOLU|nr:peptidylprolyl isomerase [Spiroplasma culicicola]AHI52378.1 peptidyl-prolyl cis-trans isomerase [Spiroplasma culicicola AES-1]